MGNGSISSRNHRDARVGVRCVARGFYASQAMASASYAKALVLVVRSCPLILKERPHERSTILERALDQTPEAVAGRAFERRKNSQNHVGRSEALCKPKRRHRTIEAAWPARAWTA